MYRRWAIWLTAAWPRRACLKPLLTSLCSQNSRNKLARRGKAGKTVQALDIAGISVQVLSIAVQELSIAVQELSIAVQVLHISSKLSCSP